MTDWLTELLTGSWKANNAKSVTRQRGIWVAHLHWMALLPSRPNRRLVAPTNYATCNAIGAPLRNGNENQKWKAAKPKAFHLRWAMGVGRWTVGGPGHCYCCHISVASCNHKSKSSRTPAGIWIKRGRGSGTNHHPTPTAHIPPPDWPGQVQLELGLPAVWSERICSAKVQGQRCCYCCSYCMHFAEITLTSG